MKSTTHRNILLFGPPGCGKTSLANATFGEAGLPVFRIKADEFLVSPRPNLIQWFQSLNCKAPCGIIIEHLDELLTGIDDEEYGYLLEQLQQPKYENIRLYVATTCHPEILLLKELDHFHDFIPVGYPDKAGRVNILNKLIKGGSTSTHLEDLAESTKWWSGKELTELITSALDENTQTLSSKLLANSLGRIRQYVNSVDRRENMLGILYFAMRRCTNDLKLQNLETQVFTISQQHDNSPSSILRNATTLEFEGISTETSKNIYRLYVESKEIPKPQDPVIERRTISEIINILEQENYDAQTLDLDGYRITPWVAYQLCNWAGALPLKSSSKKVLENIEFVTKAAKKSGDETRVFAAISLQATVYQRVGHIDKAIRAYLSIIEYSSFSALHERALAHLNLSQIMVDKKEMQKAIHYFEVGMHSLGSHITDEVRPVILRSIIEAYSDLKDLVGVFFYLNTFEPNKAQTSINNLKNDRLSLERAMMYTSRAHRLGCVELADAIYEIKAQYYQENSDE